MLNEDGLLYILPGHFQSRYQPDQDFRKEKTERKKLRWSLKSKKISSLETEPKAGTSNILKSLWFPPSTTPPRNLARLSMDVPPCLVSSGISLSHILKLGR